MSAQTHAAMSEAVYLALDHTSDHKYEYYDGQVVALAGGSAAHNRITINLIIALVAQLQHRDCSVYASDMRVKIPQTTTYVFPDVAIVCEPEAFDDADQELLLNPILVIEVLSPSTERNDRGRKFEAYRTIQTLQEYLLIAQDAKRIDHFMRQSPTLWTFSSLDSKEESLYLPCIDCTIAMNTIYNKVKLEPEA
jgi:Uma2 family endonuclease